MKEAVTRNHPKIRKKVERSLDASIKEGMWWSVHNSINTYYITPFAIAMKATASQIGILGAITNLVPAISQLSVCKLMEK